METFSAFGQEFHSKSSFSFELNHGFLATNFNDKFIEMSKYWRGIDLPVALDAEIRQQRFSPGAKIYYQRRLNETFHLNANLISTLISYNSSIISDYTWASGGVSNFFFWGFGLGFDVKLLTCKKNQVILTNRFLWHRIRTNAVFGSFNYFYYNELTGESHEQYFEREIIFNNKFPLLHELSLKYAIEPINGESLYFNIAFHHRVHEKFQYTSFVKDSRYDLLNQGVRFYSNPFSFHWWSFGLGYSFWPEKWNKKSNS